MSSYLYGNYINEFNTLDKLIESTGVDILNEFDIKEFKKKAIEAIKAIIKKFIDFAKGIFRDIKLFFSSITNKIRYGIDLAKDLKRIDDGLLTDEEIAQIEKEMIRQMEIESCNNLERMQEKINDTNKNVSEAAAKEIIGTKMASGLLIKVDCNYAAKALSIMESRIKDLTVLIMIGGKTNKQASIVFANRSDDIINAEIDALPIDKIIYCDLFREEVKDLDSLKPIIKKIDNFDMQAKSIKEIAKLSDIINSYIPKLEKHKDSIDKMNIDEENPEAKKLFIAYSNSIKLLINHLTKILNKCQLSTAIINEYINDTVKIGNRFIKGAKLSKKKNFDYLLK